MLKIERYQFGKIVVDGAEFTRDLIITPESVVPNWWRKQGHRLCFKDLEEQIRLISPEIIILGTGKFGLMRVSTVFNETLAKRKIEVIAEKTDRAVTLFNDLSPRKHLLGAFHLTC